MERLNRSHLRIAGFAVLGVLAVIVLGILSIPVTPGGYSSTTEALIRALHRKLLAVAIVLGILVEAALFYAALKFHGNDDPEPTSENRRLEVGLTIGVAVVLLFVGVASYLVLADPAVSTASDAEPAPGNVHVNVTGQNWFWTFSYPSENVTTQGTLVLPANRTVFFSVTSEDVIHSVHIPGLGVKQDAIPGQVNGYRTHLTEIGTYRLYCAEYCGAGHSKMIATVKVVSQEEYRTWLRRQRGTPKAENDAAGTGGGGPDEAADEAERRISQELQRSMLKPMA